MESIAPTEKKWMEYEFVFKALSDRNRLKIIFNLCAKEMCARELLQLLNISQPTLSHHMKYLNESGLVVSRKEGRSVYYSICTDIFHEMQDLVVDMLKWCE